MGKFSNDMGPFIKKHLHDDVKELALQYAKYPDIDMRQALVQIQGWQIAEKKLPLWAQTDGILFPVHLSMEQCSSQTTAEYKAEVISRLLPVRSTMTDLTGGYGVDATMIGRLFSHLTFVEPNADLCKLAQNNLPLLGVNDFTVIDGTCESVLADLDRQDLIFIDPSRRNANGAKTFAMEDCTPNVLQLQDQLLQKAGMVMIKLSPMLDITSVISSLKSVKEIHVVSVAGECKEILALMDSETTDSSIQVVCTNLLGNGLSRQYAFCPEDEEHAACHYTPQVGQYLYEPNASIMKAKCFKSIASSFGVNKLHPNSHLYTSDEYVPDFPGRSFCVVKTLPMDKQGIKELQTFRQANLSIRNFSSSVAELRKKLKLKEGGDLYIFFTTLADNHKAAIVCRKPTV